MMLMNARTNLIEFFRALTCLCLIQLYLLQRREPTPLLPLCCPSIFRGTELYNNFVVDNLSCIGKGAPIPLITNQMCCLRTSGDISTAVLVVSDDAGLHALVYAYILAAAREGGRPQKGMGRLPAGHGVQAAAPSPEYVPDEHTDRR